MSMKMVIPKVYRKVANNENLPRTFLKIILFNELDTKIERIVMGLGSENSH